MATFAKPENALKRAEELVNVGQKQAALQALHDLITSKRYRAWQKTLERIMFKYVELCVEMRRGRYAKDGLIQYRIVCQQVNVSSLEDVIKHFLHLSTERAEQAQALSQAEVTLDVEDLEAEKRPEDLMLSYVSGEGGKERSDRELVTPWFKFLWETYRTVLEILRNNSKLEGLYAMTAHRAFQFCLQYKRTTEFRRLCEILRNHLANLNKYKDQRDRPDLTIPESLQLYLDTRFEQLKVATELELWQEAFRSIEDIHGLMVMVKRSPKPLMMAIYYAKMIKIFWVSDCHLYHAYAWYKYYNLQKSYNKNLAPKDLQLMASSVLLATISITPYDRKHGAHHFELEMEKDRNVRMAGYLGFSLDPRKDTREVLSRSALLAELVNKGVMANIFPEVKDLYNLLENEFHPLDLAAKTQPLLMKLPKLGEKLSGTSPITEVQLEQYIPVLENLTTLRMLQQVSQVYQTIKISNLSRMIPFYNFAAVEKLAVDAAKYNFVQLKVNHLKEIVQFGSLELESDKLKNHLTILAKRLNKAISLIQRPVLEKPAKTDQFFAGLQMTVEKEHKKLLARKVLIEKRKEDQERLLLEMEREEESRRLKQQKVSEEAEAKRRASESAKREELRIRKEIEEKQLEETRQLLLGAKKGKKGKKGAIDDGDALTKTREMLIEEAVSEQIKERQEMERKLQKLVKTMDHLERAKREEERPLLEAAFLKRQEEDAIFFEQQQQQAIEQSHLQHSSDLVHKKRLTRMLDDKNAFQVEVMNRRRGEFERLRREHEEKVADMRLLRKHERDQRRKMEYYRQQEEARLLRIKEEEEKKKKEEEDRRQKEAAERKAKLDEIAAKQRQRELEVEERAKREKEAILARAEPKPGKFIPPSLRNKLAAAEDPRSQPDDSWRMSRQTDRPSTDDRWGGSDRYAPSIPRRGFPERDGPRGFSDRDGPRGFSDRDGPRGFSDRDGPRGFSDRDSSDRPRYEAPGPRAYDPPRGEPFRRSGPPDSFSRDRWTSDRNRDEDRGDRGDRGDRWTRNAPAKPAE